MSYLIFLGVVYEVPLKTDAEKAKKLILKDDKNTFIRIKEKK